MNFMLFIWLYFLVNASNSDSGSALILSPLIKNGQIQKAQTSAEVHHPLIPVRSYSGFITVNKAFDSNLFFWFFPSLTDYETAPVLLWLQGGPGGSSLFGLFTENGPIEITPNVTPRAINWAVSHSIIYIDNPVGTGFSFTNGGYAQNETAVGRDLYEALLQFFQIFPELEKNDFYVCGESYAGKYVPAIGYTIFKNNLNARKKINLQGLVIGNGWSDPINQFKRADYLYQTGLIDFNTRIATNIMEDQGVNYIQNRQWYGALKISSNVLDGDTSIFGKHTGFATYYNILDSTNSFKRLTDEIVKFVEGAEARKAIHVGTARYDVLSGKVMYYLANDYMESVSNWVSELLDHFPIVYYNGQFDPCVSYTSTVSFLQKLNFSSAAEYATAPRHKWYVKDDVAGYVKQAGNLTEVLVRNSGHMVPTDQPEWALDLITKFTRKKQFY